MRGRPGMYWFKRYIYRLGSRLSIFIWCGLSAEVNFINLSVILGILRLIKGVWNVSIKILVSKFVMLMDTDKYQQRKIEIIETKTDFPKKTETKVPESTIFNWSPSYQFHESRWQWENEIYDAKQCMLYNPQLISYVIEQCISVNARSLFLCASEIWSN